MVSSRPSHSKKNLRGNNFKEKNRQAKCGGFMVFFYFSVSLMLLLLRRCRSCHPRKGPSSREPYPLCVPLCPPLAPCVPLWGEKGGFERDTVARSQDCKILSPLILCASFPRLPHGPPHGPRHGPPMGPRRLQLLPPGFYTGSFLNSFSLPLK